ncbi:ribonuclease Z [Paenibacillus sp. LHD-117]|uniref:ribonuclease Z n=1 Tax=Paenibacillus sp. LHD-117 TaxID=3071412 RepID=UPI0027DEFE1D|nr:ribonuclease Z [Paenibacillus sp. LHD-117]MDQ6418095.1 ribonuclease Z [Paenibacillus sp. LHD-117]
MKLWFMGTGAGRPNKHRNVTSAALQLPEPHCAWWLFDAGEATQHQLMKLPLKLSKLEKIFITHLHGDHLYGLPGLLSTRSFDGGVSKVEMYGPSGLKHYIETVFGLTGTTLDYELEIHELDEQTDGNPIFKDDCFKVEAKPLVHRVPCFGYRITERDAPGRLLTDKLRELGVEAGPLYGKLKRGEAVTLADGRVVSPSSVTDGIIPGRIVTVLGDTCPCDNVRELARGADLLVHEATFAAGLEAKAHEFGHSTTTEAAEAARDAGAKQLVMTHFSGRYGNEELAKLELEAREIFPNSMAALDLGCFEIERKGSETEGSCAE